MTLPCPPQATVYCQECKHSQQVLRIKEQRCPPYVDIPEWARSVRGEMVCGHGFNVISTLATLAVMREWRPVDKGSG